MSDSIVTLTRVSPQIARVTCASPPVNLIVGNPALELDLGAVLGAAALRRARQG
ncbi:hypothetical protein [Pseudonocardia sp. WMMC193]|uniref:hypothetical protein n=1 Tax=Pseudonocardia sp. WMMC193 TaxID=2911965 RepID=UPI001F198F0D|nr:hypothetical protein [Pseudonocardia sp. WMMC193]MCF7549365.1 hypothetical protein [Pseudonocardia sp. WMMC193]